MKETIKILAEGLFVPQHAQPVPFVTERDGVVRKLNEVQCGYPGVHSVQTGTIRYDGLVDVVLTVDETSTVLAGDTVGTYRGPIVLSLDEIRQAVGRWSHKDRAALLLEIVKRWGGMDLFCNSLGSLCSFDFQAWAQEASPRIQPLGWRNPSSCFGCQKTSQLMEAVLGEQWDRSRVYPFITVSRRDHRINLPDLIVFADGGIDALQHVQRVRRAAQETEKKETARTTVMLAIGSHSIAESIVSHMIDYLLSFSAWDSVHILSDSCVVIVGSRIDMDMTGGRGCHYDSVVRVCRADGCATRIWRWRDGYSADNDRPEDRFVSAGSIHAEGTGYCEIQLLAGESFPPRVERFNVASTAT